jgi:RNAse (barnase) inhibitor barstar
MGLPVTRVFVIDGRDFKTLEGFFEAVGDVLVPGEEWGKNLDAFNDILCWPLQGNRPPYTLVWKHANLSRKWLNHLEAARHLEGRTREPRPLFVSEKVENANRCIGPTAFDWLIEIIQCHPDWLTLKLE